MYEVLYNLNTFPAKELKSEQIMNSNNHAGTKPQVRLDVYEDLLCIDCKNFKPVIKEYLDTETFNGVPVTEYIESVHHLFPWSFHHHAFLAAQLATFVGAQNHNDTEYFMFADWIYSVQDDYNAGAKELSRPEVEEKMCAEASQALDFLDEQDCIDSFRNNPRGEDARLSWKLGAYNAIRETPTLLLNGIQVPAPETVEEFRTLLTPYLNGTASFVDNTVLEIPQ